MLRITPKRVSKKETRGARIRKELVRMGRKGSFKNIKLGKNVHRQIKRRGAPAPPLQREAEPRAPKKSRP